MAPTWRLYVSLPLVGLFVEGDKTRGPIVMGLPGTVEMRLAMCKLLILCTYTQANGVRTVCGTKHLRKTSENQGFTKCLVKLRYDTNSDKFR